MSLQEALNNIKKKQDSREEVIYNNMLRALKEGCDVNQRDLSGQTLLIQAVANNMPKVASLLVEYGAELDVRDYHGLHIMYHVFNNYNKQLIDLYTNPELHIALEENELTEILKHFLYMYREGRRGTNTTKVEYVLDKLNVDLNTLTMDGKPFLFFVIDLNAPNILELAIKRGLNLFIKSTDGHNPLAYIQHKKTQYSERGTKGLITLLDELESIVKQAY